MPEETNKRLVQRLIDEVWNAREVEQLQTLWSEAGRAEVLEVHSLLTGAFPDLKIDIEDLIAEGDRVVARLTFRGTHEGSFRGIGPTGRAVEFSAIRIYRIIGEQVVETWAIQDTLGLLRQLQEMKPERGAATQRVSVISVPVSDQQAAKAFYIDSLGFELIAEATFGDDLRWIQVGPAHSQASLTLVTWFDQMPAGSLRGLVVETDDLDQDYERLTANGVSFLAPPSPQPGGTFATLTDPDGNHISLRQANSATNV